MSSSVIGRSGSRLATPLSLLLASRRNGNHKAVSSVLYPFGFLFFFLVQQLRLQ